MSLQPYAQDELNVDEEFCFDPDLQSSSVYPNIIRFSPYNCRQNRVSRALSALYGKAREIGRSSHFTKDGFKVVLNVKEFMNPKELSVKVYGHQIVVEGKHGEKEEGNHGSIARTFVRRYALPKDYDLNSIQSTRSADGYLTITATPLKKAGADQERVVPVQSIDVTRERVKKMSG